MAEGSRVSYSEGLEKQLESLLSRYSGDESGVDSELFCADFCKVVEESASHWRVPLPRLRILQVALRQFSRASAFFPTSCDHVGHTISSLALSVFELLLFFDQTDFNEEPLKHFTDTFQECHSVLVKYENVFLLQVERFLQQGGPWASTALQAILSESSLPQIEVDRYISSEPPVFLDLRVRYLSSCGRRSDAAALAKCCTRCPAAGQPLFFLQVYLSWLLRTTQHDCLHQEVADINGKDALHIICNLECEETDEMLLALSTAFLSQQLQRGDMYYLCELVLVWTSLHRRLKTSKQTLLEACRQLMLSATNVKSIFPFIRAVLQEVGEDGVQFCVELCANALRSCLPCDVLTKGLIYKTIAGLLPSDLDVCRACALLVFFLERTVESYKTVYLLYMHPDQEYHVDDSPIGNNVRFETLQVLKKDLYFDPEFWNLIALRTNCLKLMSEKVVSAALEEIMEDKWISKYCTKGSALRSVCQRGPAVKKRHKEDRFCKTDSNTATKRFKMDSEKMCVNSHALRRRGNQGSQALRESSSGPLRRSFWQLDRIHGSLTLRYDEHRRTTRFSERNLPKRKIKKPKWLLDDSGTLENVPLKMKRNGLKPQKLLRSCVMKRSQTSPMKNNAKLKPQVHSRLKPKENKYQNGFSLDPVKPANPPQIILELSLPDNELMDTFSDDSCNRPKRFSQMLLYKQTVKYPDTSPPTKTGHGKEVILRSRDATMFVQLLHCYARRQKGKGSGSNVHSSVSTITRSSAQGSPSKDSESCERPVSGPKGTTPEKVKERGLHVSEKLPKAQSTKEALDFSGISQAETEKDFQNDPSESSPAVTEGTTASLTAAAQVAETANVQDFPQAESIASGGEAFEVSAVEMKVTIASQASVLAKVSKPPIKEDVDQVSQISKMVKNKKKSTDEVQLASINNSDSDNDLFSRSEDVGLNSVEQEIKSLSSQEDGSKNSKAGSDAASLAAAEMLRKTPKGKAPHRNDKSLVKNISLAAACSSDKSIWMLPTELVTELSPEQLTDQDQGYSKGLAGKGKPKHSQKTETTSNNAVREQEVAAVDVQVKKENSKAQDTRSETSENSELMETAPETEESKLEHFCTYCNKFFMGARVVEHAMFHFRKDECTFCRTVFKDDLLAMVHLSDHIEKMKRLKTEETSVATPKTSAKAKATNVPSGHKEKLKNSASEPRTLRSNQKQMGVTSSHDKQTSKHVIGETTVHRVNGHIGKKESKKLKKDSDFKQEPVQQLSFDKKRRHRVFDSRLEENKLIESESPVPGQTNKELKSSDDGKKRRESLQLQETYSNPIVDVDVQEEKVFCPAKRCSWFTNLSKNRVGLLYHALDKHYGDIKPLELAFRVARSKCSICMRVMWSFEHFQHHIERHRLVPRHPCLHRGCKARFKSGMEMRRHTRKHSPLQAMCCRPGCSQLFICLWALNLHEREHYASKTAEPDSNANAQRGERLSTTPDGKKTQSSDDPVRFTSLKLKEQTKGSLRRRIKVPLTVRTAAQQHKLRVRNKSIDSEKDTSPQPKSINLRLRQTLSKGQVTSQAPKSHKVVSSSLLKHKAKVKNRNRLKLKNARIATRGLKKRRCPPRLSKTVAGQKILAQDAKENSDLDQKDVTTEMTSNDSEIKQIKTKQISSSKFQSTSLKQSGLTRQKSADGRKKLRKVKNHCVSSDSSKLKKTKSGRVEATKKAGKIRQEPNSASRASAECEPVKVKAVVEISADEKANNQDSLLEESSSSVPAEGAEKMSGVRKEESTNAAALSSGKPQKKGEMLKKKLNQKGKNQTLENLSKSTVEAKEQDKQVKAKGAEGILKGLKKLIKSTLVEKEKRKEAPETAALNASPPSIPTDILTACPSRVPDANEQSINQKEKRKKSKITHKSETSRATKTRKEINKDKTRKLAKKKCKEGNQPAAGKGNPPKQPSPSDINSASSSLTLKDKEWKEGVVSMPCKKTLAAYGKKPYLRLPPTAYLDEKYTAMPKRRKESPLFQSNIVLESPCLKAALQRHRCAKCFSTFSCAEELQSHSQQQKCSNLFGFDSDDEGNG
ncbi:axoneme-associated protein mst101(2)-like [Xiphophorus maculatus]|uniref:Axoneme-associated protein mst101(2)-like n=1 Tax=Xiphophorus maculatus TaxID=8083 RepID=A0A3B5Q8L3_XIPMA|nr:axoneme-associated protein mst101(2)-like [Xiphophorus maculatus]